VELLADLVGRPPAHLLRHRLARQVQQLVDAEEVGRLQEVEEGVVVDADKLLVEAGQGVVVAGVEGGGGVVGVVRVEVPLDVLEDAGKRGGGDVRELHDAVGGAPLVDHALDRGREGGHGLLSGTSKTSPSLLRRRTFFSSSDAAID
jgi:hypothetical protein